MDRRTLYLLIIMALVAHLALFLPLPLVVQAVAALIVAGLLPGALLVEALVGQSEAPPALAERLLYSIGTGYAVMVFGMLAVSYLPGPVTTWQTLLTFDLTTTLLAVFVWWRIHQYVLRSTYYVSTIALVHRRLPHPPPHQQFLPPRQLGLRRVPG